MKALLGSQEVWEVVENGHQEPEDVGEMTIAQLARLKATRAKDKTTLYVLYRAVDESGFEKIANDVFKRSVGYSGKGIQRG